jgi:hypothetical protein
MTQISTTGFCHHSRSFLLFRMDYTVQALLTTPNLHVACSRVTAAFHDWAVFHASVLHFHFPFHMHSQYCSTKVRINTVWLVGQYNWMGLDGFAFVDNIVVICMRNENGQDSMGCSCNVIGRFQRHDKDMISLFVFTVFACWFIYYSSSWWKRQELHDGTQCRMVSHFF